MSDSEIDVMRVVLLELAKLDGLAQQRVLDYLYDRARARAKEDAAARKDAGRVLAKTADDE